MAAYPQSSNHRAGAHSDLLDMGGEDDSADLVPASKAPTSPSTNGVGSVIVTAGEALLVKAVEAAANERSLLFENSTVKLSVSHEFRAYKVRMQMQLLFNSQ